MDKLKSASLALSPAALREQLAERNLKVTKPRLAVLQVLHSATTPVDVQDIQTALKLAIDQVTVYRILQSFVTAGLIRKVNLRHGHSDYEIVSASDHHHLVCLKCGLIEDFEGCHADQLAKIALKNSRHFKQIQDHALELFGYCKTCEVK